MRRLSASEWRSVSGMALTVLGLHVAGLFILIALVAPRHHGGAAGGFGIGLGVTAYTLGLRHAFDADHISAIDNTTRKLMAERQRPLSVGFWFSLGHSTVVFGLSGLFALGVRALEHPVRNPDSVLHGVTSLIGTGVSGGFLYAIAAVNLVILLQIVRVVRDMRAYDESDLERRLNARGLMNRILGRVSCLVGRPWHMYPLGLLFGLGFDTATEVALVFLAAGAADSTLPFYAILCLPLLFAAGMSLLDSIDGTFMNFAYGWAFSKPVRKVFYNLTITGLSVAVAFIVGTVEIVSLLVGALHLSGPVWSWVGKIDLNTLGYVIVGLFVVTWASAILVWRLAGLEERWSARPSPDWCPGPARPAEPVLLPVRPAHRVRRPRGLDFGGD
jgi:high-affinity nickel-transport protein